MRAIGIILAGGGNHKLGELTKRRAAGAMPIGSCYRSIDFVLSNMSNSGIGKVAVITQYNSRSLHDHLSSAKWWDLGRKQGGLFVFSPYLSGDNSAWFRGTADSIYQNITFLKKSNEPYVVIAGGDAIYKMDYNDILKKHVETKADVTVVYRDMKDKDVRSFGVMEMDSKERVLEFEEKPLEPESSTISTGIYIFDRLTLIKLLETINSEGRYDLVDDLIIRYRKKLKIIGHKFEGYWKPLHSVSEYYNINMDFLNREVRYLFTKEYPYICTKPKDEPPAKYNMGAKISNSLIGSGSIINGAVNNSILFRKVCTGENTIVSDSIIMEGTYIGNNCIIENAILDKDVVLSDGKQIIGEKGNPIIISKGTVV